MFECHDFLTHQVISARESMIINNNDKSTIFNSKWMIIGRLYIQHPVVQIHVRKC